MKKVRIFSLVLFLVMIAVTANQPGMAGERGIINTSSSPFVKLRSVDIDDVRWTEGFWADKFEVCHQVMVPYMWSLLNDPELSHAWENFRIVAGLAEGEFKGTCWYDGDVYKWIEAASYVYAVTKDEELDDLMDSVIEVIAKAQDDDGYISTYIQIGHGLQTGGEGGTSPYRRYDNVDRWVSLGNHELYNMGHLMTAGSIHHRATGKNNFLDIARKNGTYLYSVFRPENRPKDMAHFGFNPSNIMGAVELYRTTGDRTYLRLAEAFVDMRGSAPDNSAEYRKPLDMQRQRGGTDHNQTRTPLRQETEAVGHAVTANYLYAGTADVYAETGDVSLLEALERIWRDAVDRKMYITGATCAYHRGLSSAGDRVGEAYGNEYDLPNLTAYNETCSNIANGMWNWRMLAITGEARFAEIFETVLYNSGISGISLDGKHYCYTNPLRWFGHESPHMHNDTWTRLPYLGCFCCPPNVVRTIAKSGGYAYSVSDAGLWVNLYGSNELGTELTDGSRIELTQESDYPWDGDVKIVMESSIKKECAVLLRIPQWAAGTTVTVNGVPVNRNINAGSYFEVRRLWKKGDTIDMKLPLNMRLITADPKVEHVRNQVAVKRGPVVYCLESHDLPGGVGISQVVIPYDIEMTPRYDGDFLNGVTVLEGDAYVDKRDEDEDKLYREAKPLKREKLKLKLIPYYSWNNRGVAYMTVWMPVDW